MLLLHVLDLEFQELSVSLTDIQRIARLESMHMDLDQILVPDDDQRFSAHVGKLLFQDLLVESLEVVFGESHDEFRAVTEFLVLQQQSRIDVLYFLLFREFDRTSFDEKLHAFDDPEQSGTA